MQVVRCRSDNAGKLTLSFRTLKPGIMVGQMEAITDENGGFRIEIPLQDQLEVQHISIKAPLFKPFVRVDESPSDNLEYLLHR